MGWRHTPIGLNLNRDYTKLDAPEMRALIGNVYTKWWPDLLIDNHTTDGADYRYDVTYATNHGAGVPPSLDRWYADAIEKGMVSARGARRTGVALPRLQDRQRPARRHRVQQQPAALLHRLPAAAGRAALLVETTCSSPTARG
jgi:hypothetical protein